MHRFDPAALKHRLATLPPQARVAFALASAERLASRTDRHPDSEPYNLAKVARDLAAAFVDGVDIDLAGLDALLSRLGASPHIDDDDLAACFHVLECVRSKDPQAAVWAAQRAYEACDLAAQERVGGTSYTAQVESALRSDPEVQAELSSQSADLATLAADAATGPVVVGRVRALAKGPHA